MSTTTLITIQQKNQTAREFLVLFGKMPKKPGWIQWQNSHSRCIVIEDLVRGVVGLEDADRTAEEVWEIWYKHTAEFVQEGVTFEQFKERFKDHRKQVKKGLKAAVEEEELLMRDRALFPGNFRNHNGSRAFDLHPARDLLRQDVADKKHETQKPSVLWQTRPEYQEFELADFRQQIYQTVRRQKFLNYLRHRREVKKQLVRCKPPVYK